MSGPLRTRLPMRVRQATRALPLSNPSALSGVVLFLLCAFLGFTFWGSERQERVASTLTTHALELAVLVVPHDEALRMRLAHKRFDAGHLERARELVLREFRDQEERALAD